MKQWSGNVTRDLAKTIHVTEAAGILALSVYSYCESCKSTDKLTAIRNYQPLYDRKQRSFLNKQFDFLNDKLIWDFLGAYLQSCAKEYIKKVNTDEKLSKMQKELELSYKKVTGDSIIGSVQVIENFLADFEKNID